MKQTKNLCQGTASHKHKVPQKEQRQENNAAWWCNLNRKLLQSVFKTWMTLQLVTVTTPALNSPNRASTAAPHVGKEVLTLSSCSCTIPSISAGLMVATPPFKDFGICPVPGKLQGQKLSQEQLMKLTQLEQSIKCAVFTISLNSQHAGEGPISFITLLLTAQLVQRLQHLSNVHWHQSASLHSDHGQPQWLSPLLDHYHV